jgi:AraC family transcriptional activator of pobA
VRPARPILHDHPANEGRAIVASRQAPDDRTAPRRAPVTHSYAAVSFYVGGRARVEQNGEWHLGEGDLLVLPAGEPHRMLELRRAEYWCVGLSVASLASDGATSLLEPFERVRDGGASVVHVRSDRHVFLESLFRELVEVGAEATTARDTVERSLVTLILSEIDRATVPTARRGRGGGGGVVAESLRYIERNCLRRLTLAEIASAVGRSPTYVTAALTRATGRSAGDWIVSGRMAEARRLLLRSDERVDVVSERVGYADPTHFIRMFRRAHGTTPAAWRASRTGPE